MELPDVDGQIGTDGMSGEIEAYYDVLGRLETSQPEARAEFT